MDLHNQEIKEKRKIYRNKPQTIKKMAIGTDISIITLNVSGLNAPTKRDRLAQWIQKQVKVKVKSLSRVRFFATPWTGAYQAPPTMGFSRQECWSGLP